MPTGSYTSRLEENEFKPKSSIIMAIEWLKWVAHRDRIYMRHQLNNTEKDIGDRKLPVDDLNAQTQKVVLATPLLKWSWQHGLEVIKVHQVVEFTPEPCLRPFGDAVSDARRALTLTLVEL